MDWSPDGTLLAFGGVDVDVIKRLYTLTVGGGPVEAVPITPGTRGEDERPVFSPDGGELLFIRYDPQVCAANYWAIRPDGSGERQLTSDDLCEFDPEGFGHDWSPDGSLIVLMGATSGISPDAVFVVPRDVSPATYLEVGGRRLIRDTGGSVPGDIQPSWRP
jgi:Tol biopolymer transport system component